MTGTNVVNSKWQLIVLWNEVNIVLQFRYDIRSFDNSDLGFAGYVGPGTTSLLLPGGSGTWRSSSNVGVNGLYIYYLPVAPSKTRVASTSRNVSPVMTVSDRQEPDGSGWHVIVAVVVPGVVGLVILFAAVTYFLSGVTTTAASASVAAAAEAPTEGAAVPY